ncbi:MAG: replication-relaxation family protein [Thermoanaerobaculia bacterium]|nr:replication-relaxation family protein [Thermoanaerobaculia bacterium]
MRDPREAPALPARDLVGLAFIGGGWEVAQYQLRDAVFPGLSEVVASRRVRTWARLKLIHVERWMGVGMNLLRLTPSGRDFVVAARFAKEDDLFAPPRSVALKDLRHLLFVNDVRTLALRGVPIRADGVSPAWLLQRRIQPPPPAIPDLLLTARAKNGRGGRLLAVEIDLGAERLTATFLPKLRVLVDVLQDWAGGVRTGVIVLTRGPKRLEALRAGIEEMGLAVPILAEELPSATGFEALACLDRVLRQPAQTSEHPEEG